MATSATLPKRRDDLVLSQVADDRYVVKIPAKGVYYQIGAIEFFLLEALDGESNRRSLRERFEERFGEALSRDDLKEFLRMAEKQGLIAGSEPQSAEKADAENEHAENSTKSIVFYRLPVCRPDRFFSWLEPRLRFLWTPGFVVVTGLLMLAALAVLVANRAALVSAFPQAMRWETLVLVGVGLFLATCIHECGHGLTCKHFGGEVPDAGILFMLFMPCFYCNVTDAWLIRQKSRRLWITFAGAWADLCIWALAVFVWRVTVPTSLVNHLALVMLSVCGTRTLLNVNPFLRLDGYYMLADAVDAPNLRARALEHFMAHVRWLLWGAERPAPQPNGRMLLVYGLAIWIAAIVFLDFVIFTVVDLVGGKSKWFGWGIAGLLIMMALKRVSKGLFKSEFAAMLTKRRKRVLIWCLVLFGIPGLIALIPVRNAATGEFTVRPVQRTEVHAPVAGFIHVVHVEEGDRVKTGAVLVELVSPEIASEIVRKRAELRESQANLTKLQSGARDEQIVEQRKRVERARAWRDRGREDLKRARITLKQDLRKLDLEISQYRTEMQFARDSLDRAEKLFELGALAGEQFRDEKKRITLLTAKLEQAQTTRKIRETNGIENVSAELAKRESDLADARAQLSLLEAGTRPEEIEAEQARQARLQEELKSLTADQSKLVIRAPVAGVVATPLMRELKGKPATKGLLICTLEDVSSVHVEISVAEDDMQGLSGGQSVSLKARSLPFQTFEAAVDHIAPTAAIAQGASTSTVKICCHVDNARGKLKTGMTGFARIVRNRKPLGMVLYGKTMKYLRTEFWW